MEVLCEELLKEKPDKKKIKGLMFDEGIKFEEDSLLQLSTVLNRLDQTGKALKAKPLTNIQARSKRKATKSNSKLKVKVKSNETSL